MIKSIAHFADIHIEKSTLRHQEYREVFSSTYTDLKEKQPDRILIAGDLYHDFINLEGEALILAAEFLNNLSKIAPVVITRGNHDVRKKHIERKDVVDTITTLINNNNITFHEKSGFYVDENVTWVVWDYGDKLNPWVDIQHTKDKKQIYIDVFHNPIMNCLADNGEIMNRGTLTKSTEFKGDLGMFGDIHKRQFLNKAKTQAYCGSLIHRSFGEETERHGYLLWDITTKSATEINIHNDVSYHNFYLEEPDYKALETDKKLQTTFTTTDMQVKVHWQDFTANINLDNEMIIRNVVGKKYNIDPGKVKFKKNHLYQKVVASQRLTEALNLQDPVVQHEIFTEYLESNKYDETFITEILKIDDLITGRLQLPDSITNAEWSIVDMWIDNFKSYSEAKIEWETIHGIVQISGFNKQGKTTIFDAICYILFGTTISTNKLGGAQREKHGDNRYINNARDLDYCNGGIVLNVSGDYYTVVRKTERTWGKGKKAISAVSTDVEYYSGMEAIEENKLRDERKSKTQTLINNILGDFEDFVRLSLTNSENLNALLSMDRASFIDAIIRDAGYDLFEKKLDEFKEYKKELKEDRINLDINDAEYEVTNLKTMLLTYKDEAGEVQKEITKYDGLLTSINEKRDVQLKKLNPIDADVASIDVDTLNERLEEYRTAITTNLTRQKANTEKGKTLRKEYDSSLLESKVKEIQKIDDDQLNTKLKISQNETAIEKEKGKIKNFEGEKQTVVNTEIRDTKDKIKGLERELEGSKVTMTSFMNDIAQKIKDLQKDYEFEIKNINTELSGIKEKGLVIKKQIKELEEGKICPTCNRPYEEDHQHTLDLKVAELNGEIVKLMEKVKPKQAKIKEIEPLIEECKVQLQKIKDGEFTNNAIELKKKELEENDKETKNEIIKLDIYINSLNDGVYSGTIDGSLRIIDEKIKSSEFSIYVKEEEIKDFNTLIKSNDIKKGEVQLELQHLEVQKNEVLQYTQLVNENNELALKVENIKLTIENAKHNIDKYYSQLEKIKENKVIQIAIDDFDINKREYDVEKNYYTKKLQEIYTEAGVTKNTIKDIQDRINKYKEQVKMDVILKQYECCVHRDGIPSFLLKKSIHLINAELSNLLTDVDFIVYFNEDLQLKMSPLNRLNVAQNALEGSGAERSFISFALKIALREINTKSKPNMILLDEIMSKLTGDSVEIFKQLLENSKKKIDKICIVEHNHNISYDFIIEVKKDRNDVSSLSIS